MKHNQVTCTGKQRDNNKQVLVVLTQIYMVMAGSIRLKEVIDVAQIIWFRIKMIGNPTNKQSLLNVLKLFLKKVVIQAKQLGRSMHLYLNFFQHDFCQKNKKERKQNNKET